jgi:hypothetical protein
MRSQGLELFRGLDHSVFGLTSITTDVLGHYSGESMKPCLCVISAAALICAAPLCAHEHDQPECDITAAAGLLSHIHPQHNGCCLIVVSNHDTTERYLDVNLPDIPPDVRGCSRYRSRPC